MQYLAVEISHIGRERKLAQNARRRREEEKVGEFPAEYPCKCKCFLVQLAQRDDLAYVGIAVLVFRQRNDVVARMFGVGEFNAEDRLNAVFHAQNVKIDEPAHAIGVGEGQRSHAMRLCRCDKLLYLWHACVEGVLGVSVKMGELHII